MVQEGENGIIRYFQQTEEGHFVQMLWRPGWRKPIPDTGECKANLHVFSQLWLICCWCCYYYYLVTGVVAVVSQSNSSFTPQDNEVLYHGRGESNAASKARCLIRRKYQFPEKHAKDVTYQHLYQKTYKRPVFLTLCIILRSEIIFAYKYLCN